MHQITKNHKVCRTFFALEWNAAVSCGHLSSMINFNSCLISGYCLASCCKIESENAFTAAGSVLEEIY